MGAGARFGYVIIKRDRVFRDFTRWARYGKRKIPNTSGYPVTCLF